MPLSWASSSTKTHWVPREGFLVKTASAVGEGAVDIEVCRRLAKEVGVVLSATYVTQGSQRLDSKLASYNQAARFSRWLVLRDLDQAECAVMLRQRLLPKPADHMRFRIAVREVEAWLIADRERLARFLHVSPARITKAPDALDDPKRELVNLARASRNSRVRDGLVPPEGGQRTVGPGYTTLMSEFILRAWRPREAAKNSPSLRRCLQALDDW
jgi:hypothetical protein